MSRDILVGDGDSLLVIKLLEAAELAEKSKESGAQ